MLKIRAINYEVLERLVPALNRVMGGDCKLEFCDHDLMPYLKNDKEDKSKMVIVFSKRIEAVLSMFTAYKYEPEILHKILFLYLMANRHIDIGNWDNARIVLQALKKETTLLPLSHNLPKDYTFYLDFMAEAMMAHEYGHYCSYKHNDAFKKFEEQVVDILNSSRPEGLKGLVVGFLLDRLFKDWKLMDELTCDAISMNYLSGAIRNANLSPDETRMAIQQIVRMFASMEYFDTILPSRHKSIKKAIARFVFDKVRVGLISYHLNETLEKSTPELLVEEMKESRLRLQRVRKIMFRKLKYHRMREDISSVVREEDQQEIIKDLMAIEKKLFDWYSNILYTRDFSGNGFDDEYLNDIIRRVISSDAQEFSNEDMNAIFNHVISK